MFFKNDNDGPPSVEEIHGVYATLRTNFPNAEVFASNFEDFLDAAKASGALDLLPILSDIEIGDTWIHGMASDPARALMGREIMRARSECIADGLCTLEDPKFYNFSRILLKGAEHTNGGDVKRFLEAEGDHPEEDYYRWSNEGMLPCSASFF